MGHGKTDILERFRVGGNGGQQRLYESTPDGNSWRIITPFANIGGPLVVMETGDFDGDGLLDVLVADQPPGQYAITNWRMCWGRLRIGDSFSCDSPISFPADAFSNFGPPQPARMVKDFNADGRDDLFLRASEGSFPVDSPKYMCLSTGSAFSCTNVKGTSEEVDFGDGNSDTAGTVAGSAYADIDGDGRVDVFKLPKCIYRLKPDGGNPPKEWYCGDFGSGDNGAILVYGQTERGAYKTFGSWFTFTDMRSAVLTPPTTGTLTGDFNADGYSDIVFGSGKLGLYGGDPTALAGYSCYSKGDGSGDCRPLPASTLNGAAGIGLDHLVLTVGDFNGDGMVDVLRPGHDTWNVADVTSYQLCRIWGNASSHSCETWAGPTFFSLSGHDRFTGSSAEDVIDRKRSMFFGDFNGDGKTDIVSYLGGNRWQVFGAAAQANAGEAIDKLINTTNGVGLVERIEYAAVNDAAVYNPTALDPQGSPIATSYPIKRANNSRALVKTLRRSNGQGGWLTSSFTYAGYAYDATGRGNLGFARQDVTDLQSGINTTSWYRQDFPFNGMLSASQTTTANSVPLSKTSQQMDVRAIAQANGKSTLFPHVISSTVAQRDLGNQDLGTTTTLSQYTDGWGNLTDNMIVAALNGVAAHLSSRVIVFDNDVATWRIGEARSVTETRIAPGSTIARLVEYTYGGNGLRETETRQGDDVRFKVKTTYGRSNVFGLVNTTTLNWIDLSGTSITRVPDTTIFDAKGRFPVTKTNAIGHVTTMGFDARTGTLSRLTSSNGLTVTSTSDGFGRKTSEVGADGTEARTATLQCTANCPADARVVIVGQTMRAGVRIAAPVLSYHDNAGRALRTQSWGLDGHKIVTDKRFDSRGRLWESDWPRYESDGAILANRLEYDELNRVVSNWAPDETGTLANSQTFYQGVTTVLINAKNQRKTDTRDVWGRLTSSTDAKAGITGFEYDAYNNLTKTTDPALNVIVVEYDKLGRKTDLRDPDLGWIHYSVDPVGQVVAQVNPVQRAASRSTTFQYDPLGRMIARDETDLKSRWDYDKYLGQGNCADTKSCGQLIEAYTLNGTTKDYRRTHTYDGFGRPDTATTYLDAVYTSKTEYDAWGRPIRQRHQRGSAIAKVFDQRYNAFGHLSRIERGALVLWRANAQDAANRVTNATLGNGLNVGRVYYPQTGRLKQGTVQTEQGLAQLLEGYSYDRLGNVELRSQYWPAGAGFTENFIYDDLNRLEKATVSGFPVQSFTYDAVGNMLSKTGLGSGNYAYPAAGANSVRPHAVSGIPGIGAFHYDDNGNLSDGAGRTLHWTSFDMPLDISKDGASSSFVYGADHQRIRQDKSDGTRISYAGAMEVETRNTVSTVKTYWPMGLGVEIDTPGAITLNWTHVDRLGSVVAISDQNGNLREQLAYDSWGKRRALTGNATPDNIDGVTDNKGFTGHEMLDQLDLVHMNGRMYDPFIARFMSPDPFIQDPSHSQSFNRYSYVWNNPTNLTDPSGFEAASPYAATDGSCDSRCQQLQREADKMANNCIGNCSYSGPGRTEQQKNNSADNSGAAKYIPKPGGASGRSSATGESVEYVPKTLNPDWLAERERYYGTPGEVMAQWMNFNPFERLASDAGAGRRTAMVIGFAGMMIGNPKALVANAFKKATQYSVAFEVNIAKAGIGTRAAHFKDANTALDAVIKSDVAFAKSMEELGIKVPEKLGQSPANWSWHHVPDQPGVLQLIPREQHQGSFWQSILHPGREGGFKLWGIEF